jgi:hypothetical protein
MPTAHAEQPFINATRTWLEKVVIGYNLCPFAQRELAEQRVHFAVCNDADTVSGLHALIAECVRLDANDDIGTTLLIFSQAGRDFDDYLDFLALADDLLVAQGYEGIYQLASFHPNYCFADAEPNDAANYTNRAPFPMLHLLREADISAALARYPHAESIPERNMALTRQLGVQTLQRLLDKCV